MKKRSFFKVLAGIITLSLALANLTACFGSSNDTSEDDSRKKKTSDEKTDDASLMDGGIKSDDSDYDDVSSALRSEFADSEEYIFTEPLYNLNRGFKFAFSGKVATDYDLLNEALKENDELFRVYASENFNEQTEVLLHWDADEDLGKLVVYPADEAYNVAEALGEEREYNNYSNSSWGNAAKYYFIQYVDFNTGETLEKPYVTLFTIKAELDAPRLQYGVDKDGNGSFYWDEIDGAQSYLIGCVQIENGFPKHMWFEAKGQVSETYWNKFSQKVTTNGEMYAGYDYGAAFPKWYSDSAYCQNRKIDDFSTFILDYDGYFVMALNSNGNSNISNIITFDEFAPLFPYKPAQDEDNASEEANSSSLVLRNSNYEIAVDSVEKAPIFQAVEMLDGSIKNYVIEYPEDETGIETSKNGEALRIITKTSGTMFMNGIVIKDTEGRSNSEVLQYLKEREKSAGKSGGAAGSGLTFASVPSVNNDFGNSGDLEAPDNSDNSDNSRNNGVSSEDIIFTDVYANSALSKYIALCLTNHVEEIPLSDFPEAADGDVLIDAFEEAYWENNAYIGGAYLNNLGYDYYSRTLYVDYVFSESEQKALQKAVSDKAEEVVAKVVTDNMTDLQKEMALNDYLCENAQYDFPFLDAIEKSSDPFIIDGYERSQTAYGVLINGVGICQSYAEAFKALADKAGLQTVIMGGVLNGMGGHAWNRVNIDGQWFTLDVTNNDNDNAFFRNEYFNMPDEIARIFVTDNKDFVLDNLIPKYTADEYGYDYFSAQGDGVTSSGLGNYLSKKASGGEDFMVTITDILDASNNDIDDAVYSAFRDYDKGVQWGMMLWVLRVDIEPYVN